MFFLRTILISLLLLFQSFSNLGLGTSSKPGIIHHRRMPQYHCIMPRYPPPHWHSTDNTHKTTVDLGLLACWYFLFFLLSQAQNLLIQFLQFPSHKPTALFQYPLHKSLVYTITQRNKNTFVISINYL